MRRIGVYIQNEKVHIVIEKGDEVDVFVVNDVFVKQESKRWKMNVYIRNDSGQIITVCWGSAEHDPVGVMTSADEGVSFAVGRTRDLSNF